MSEWWRRTTEVFLGRRSLRFFDSYTGYWVICYRAGKRILCYYWDPSEFRFAGKVEEIYECGVKMCGYCSRSDRTRNVRAEALYCKPVYVWRTARYRNLRHMYRYIASLADHLKSMAEQIIDNCFGKQLCDEGEEEEGVTLTTFTRYRKYLAYNRCDRRYRVCDPDSCDCTRASIPYSVLEIISGSLPPEISLDELLDSLFDPECFYSELRKQWVCE
jgi:hypothetical protein